MRKIKNYTAGILYRLILLIVKLLPAKKGNNHLLVIRPDEIGDYILFRNLLKYIRDSAKYKDFKITLIGNISWKQLFDEYDSDTVDDTIWINKKKLNKDLLYRFKLLKQIRYLHTSDVINFLYTRSLILDDGFALVATGDNKTAMKGHKANIGRYAITIDKFIYTEIMNAGDETVFDTIRDKNLLSKILMNNEITIDSKIGIEWSGSSSDYYAVFIGAGNPERQWPIEYFIKCAEYIWSKHKLVTAIFGGASDEENAEIFMQSLKGKAINYTSKTTLPQFIDLLNKAKFMISVDTGPLHMGVAAGCPVIGLFSGKYYKRYSPYPQEITKMFFPLYPDFVDKLIAEDNPILFNPFITKNDTIKFISPDKVIAEIDKLLTLI